MEELSRRGGSEHLQQITRLLAAHAGHEIEFVPDEPHH